MTNDEPRLRIYWRHDGIEEWVATATLVRGALTPLVGGCNEDVWEQIVDAVYDGDLTGTVTASDGTVYTYEAQ